MIEKQGMVSIWLGNSQTQSELESYVQSAFDEDGEFVPSAFFTDFKIDPDETDEDFIEKAIVEHKSDQLFDLLKGCSYEEVILSEISPALHVNKHYNAVILLYNFDYENLIKAAGNVEYITFVRYIRYPFS